MFYPASARVIYDVIRGCIPGSQQGYLGTRLELNPLTSTLNGTPRLGSGLANSENGTYHKHHKHSVKACKLLSGGV